MSSDQPHISDLAGLEGSQSSSGVFTDERSRGGGVMPPRMAMSRVTAMASGATGAGGTSGAGGPSNFGSGVPQRRNSTARQAAMLPGPLRGPNLIVALQRNSQEHSHIITGAGHHLPSSHMEGCHGLACEGCARLREGADALRRKYDGLLSVSMSTTPPKAHSSPSTSSSTPPQRSLSHSFGASTTNNKMTTPKTNALDAPSVGENAFLDSTSSSMSGIMPKMGKSVNSFRQTGGSGQTPGLVNVQMTVNEATVMLMTLEELRKLVLDSLAVITIAGSTPSGGAVYTGGRASTTPRGHSPNPPADRPESSLANDNAGGQALVLEPAPSSDGGQASLPTQPKQLLDPPIFDPMELFKADTRRQSTTSSLAASIASIPIQAASQYRKTSVVDHNHEADGFSQLNQFMLLEELGAGSQGSVVLAYDQNSNEFRAIKDVKKPLPSSLKMQQLRSEIAIMKRLRHRNLISLYEVIDDPSCKRMYLVMQYAERGCLVNYTNAAKTHSEPLNEIDFIHIARQCCSGLTYLHNHDVFHGDIKPENILRGKDEQIYLADFGVSRSFATDDDEDASTGYGPTDPESRRQSCNGHDLSLSPTNSTKSGRSVLAMMCPPSAQVHERSEGPLAGSTRGQHFTIEGTPAFLAPELLSGANRTDPDQCRSADVWALGITFYVLLTGQLPWLEKGSEAMPEWETYVESILTKPLQFPPTLHRQWCNIISMMTHKAPEHRASLEEVRNTVRAMKVTDLMMTGGAAAGGDGTGTTGRSGPGLTSPNRLRSQVEEASTTMASFPEFSNSNSPPASPSTVSEETSPKDDPQKQSPNTPHPPAATRKRSSMFASGTNFGAGASSPTRRRGTVAFPARHRASVAEAELDSAFTPIVIRQLGGEALEQSLTGFPTTRDPTPMSSGHGQVGMTSMLPVPNLSAPPTPSSRQ